VVLIHGALRSRAGWLPVAWWLQRQGFEPIPFGYATRREPLERHAERLAEVLAARSRDAIPVLGLLTHSMGGLVARAYLSQYGAQQSHAQRLVMLAPPNQGSAIVEARAEDRLFRAAYGRAVDALHPTAVAQMPALPQTCDALVLSAGRGDARGFNPRIRGDDDGVVSVAETHLAGSDREFIGGLHSFVQWRPSVLRRAADHLRG
jgi:pimeloyl-ACP methyl ester carboxylesterase